MDKWIHKKQKDITAKILINSVDNNDCALAQVKLILLIYKTTVFQKIQFHTGNRHHLQSHNNHVLIQQQNKHLI
jgi:hypothetical protein